jgi:hypothetical protein
MTTKPPPLEDFQRKQLLTFIEEAGGLGVANFKLICDKNWQIFGKPGPGIRRSFQNELSNIVKRSPRSYLKLLAHHSVTPSPQSIDKAEFGPYMLWIVCFP